MSDCIRKDFKKSNINASSEFDFYQIKRKSEYLLDCEVFRDLDEIGFEFIIDKEQPFNKVNKLPQLAKYQALINIKNLYTDSQRLSISLNPDNLYFDINKMPKAMLRDVYGDVSFDENDFVQQYKAIIGYVLQSKYSFNDYYQGGNNLLNKNKNTAIYVDASTVEEIVDLLNKDYKSLQKKRQLSIIEVDKKQYTILKIISRVIAVLLVISIIIAGYFGVYRLNEEKVFNRANEFYIKQDYASVIDTLDNTKIGRMNTNIKYVLAIANIKTESLNDEQKSNILSGITLNSDSRVLEFWIYLGKGDMDKSIDIAKQLGDKEYLAYAYMKQKAQVENDKSLSGEERDAKLKAIEDNLKNIDINKKTTN